MRTHSLDWLRRLGREHSRRVRVEMADQLALQSLAASAPHSEEAGTQVQEVLEELRAEAEDSTPHITNPDAATDWAALQQLGALQRQPKEEVSNGRPG